MIGFICVVLLIIFICILKKFIFWCKKNYVYIEIKNVKEMSKRFVIFYKVELNYRKIISRVWVCNRVVGVDIILKKGKIGKNFVYSDIVVGFVSILWILIRNAKN